MLKESIIKIKIGKSSEPLGVVSEMVKIAREAGVDVITDLVYQIIVKEVIPAEWELLYTVVHCCKGKCGFLERGDYRGLKLTDQILKIAERIIEKFIRQQREIDEMVLCQDMEPQKHFLS